MNSEIFESNNIINQFFQFELNEYSYFFSCHKCFNYPDLILNDKENLIISCKKCNEVKTEKIDDITNYSSQWVTNAVLKTKINRSSMHKEEYSKLYSEFIKSGKDESFLDQNYFQKFLEELEKTKNEKFAKIKRTIIYLESCPKSNNNSLKNIQSNILSIFYNDLKTEQNLIFLAKILFVTCIRINNIDDYRIKQYIQIFNVIKMYFGEEEVENFNNLINKEIEKYRIILSDLSQEEINSLENNINYIFQPNNENVSDFDRKKIFIQNNIEYSATMKKYITIQKEKNPDNYIDMEQTINNIENINKDFNSKENADLILSLLGKCYQNNGIEINISKTEEKKFKNIELASIQSLFSLGNQKKYEFHFDFGKEINQKILESKEEQEKFLNEWKTKLSNKLNINSENIILTDVHHGCVGVFGSVVNSTKKQEEAILSLGGFGNITKVGKKPVLESLQINSIVLDPQGDRSQGWGINETRGGEKYIPPIGWCGIGLNVNGKYDNGNNDWLDYRNRKGEFAVAYLGINNYLESKTQIISDLNNYIQKIDNCLSQKLFQEEVDIRRWNFFISHKCGDGVCLFQDPKYAENYAGVIDILGFQIKILLMCRVNPDKIRQPKSFPEFWILNPTPNEIRPYRILIKKISTSQITNDCITSSTKPVDYIVSAIKSNDHSFYGLSKNQAFSFCAYINSQINLNYFAIRLYSSSYFPAINEYLRNRDTKTGKLKGLTESQLKSWICCLHLELKNNKNVKENQIVYRALRDRKFPSDIGIGSKFYFREFISTSTRKKFALDWLYGQNGTILIIKLKNNGTNGHPNYCFYIEGITISKNQYEVLLSSHCYFTLTNRDFGKKIEYVHLTCEGYLLD